MEKASGPTVALTCMVHPCCLAVREKLGNHPMGNSFLYRIALSWVASPYQKKYRPQVRGFFYGSARGHFSPRFGS